MSFYSEKEIALTDAFFLAQGYHKKCYIHPENDLLCIKIPYLSEHGDGLKEIKREIRFNEFAKKNKNWSRALPSYHGKVKTNVGEGVVYELIRDYDGQISKSLGEYMLSEGFLEKNFAKISSALKVLKESMIKDQIITMNLFAHNMLYQKIDETSVRLVLIDDLGTPTLIPLEYYIPFIAKAKVKRKWRRFVFSLKTNFVGPCIDKLIEEIC